MQEFAPPAKPEPMRSRVWSCSDLSKGLRNVLEEVEDLPDDLSQLEECVVVASKGLGVCPK